MGARGPGGEGREGGASGWQSCGAGTAGAKKAQSRGESGGPRGIHHLRRRQRGSPRPDPQPPLRCHRSQGSIMKRGNGEGVSIAYVIQRAREVTSGTSGTRPVAPAIDSPRDSLGNGEHAQRQRGSWWGASAPAGGEGRSFMGAKVMRALVKEEGGMNGPVGRRRARRTRAQGRGPGS
jgi:hypothetical protein